MPDRPLTEKVPTQRVETGPSEELGGSEEQMRRAVRPGAAELLPQRPAGGLGQPLERQGRR